MPVAAARRWLLVVLLASTAAVALFALLGYVVAPGIVRDQLVERLGRELSRPVRIERVEVRPFALAATVHGLAVDQPGGASLLAVEAIEADFSAASLWHRAPVVDALRIVHPRVAISRLDATRYDVSDLLDRWLAPSAEPGPRYSLNNIEVVGGRVDFDDRPVGRTHRIDAIGLGVPFLSSLPYAVEINVEPRLAARVNGSPFALTGRARPYAERHEAAVEVNVDALPLPEYVAYLPARPNFRLAGGTLATRLTVSFAKPPGAAPEVTVAGTLSLAGLDVRRRDGAPLVALREARATIDKLDVGARSVSIAEATIDAPSLAVRRLADGSLELAGAWFEGGDAPSAAATRWQVAIARASVKDGRASIEDASIAPPYQANVAGFTATASTLATGAERSGRVGASFRIDDEASASLAADVALAPFSAAGRFEVTSARLARLYPYAAQALELTIQRGSADYASAFELAADGAVRLTAGKAVVRDVALALPGEREPLLRAPELAGEAIEVDVPARRVSVAAVSVGRPQVVAARDTAGRWNLARLVRTTADTGATKARATDDTWQLRVAKLAIDRGDVALRDATTKPPLAVRADEITLAVTDFGNARDLKSGIDVRARVERSGRIAARGRFGSNPAFVALDVQATRLPLLAVKPLLEREANLILAGGSASARGRLEVQPGMADTMRTAWNGDVMLEDVAALDPPTGGRLFAWKSLALSGLQARSEPLEASVATLALSDFYARLIVYSDGTLNLAQLARSSDAAAVAPAAAPTRSAGAMAGAAQAAERTLRRAVDGSLPLAVGRIELERGNVNFSDLFIRPNYSANLTQVAGTVTTMSASQAGEVALTAQVDDAAPVTVSGRIQPFARELSLALSGKARDIELPPLSPYAAKYAGYGITKGKLAFDVDYKVENRKLDARNRLVLDQLTFGDPVASPEATKLPVLLAVALLKDGNGVIDLDLPISGTLDDPQFSVFGLIVRVIVNLLAKAATAPFALLGAIAGGGEELAWIEFPAGSATLDAAAAERLDKLGKALGSRPGLKVDVTGRVDAATDRDALAAAGVDAALRAAKMKTLAGKPEAPATLESVAIGTEERAQWVTAAYRALPDAAQEATPADMEAALLQRHRPDEAALGALGLARARAAKDALAARGVAAERVFLVAPKAGEGAGKGAPRRVDFALK